jgi:copper transport protein
MGASSADGARHRLRVRDGSPRVRVRILTRVRSVLVTVALVAAVAPASASGHAALIRSDPAPGAALGASPNGVRLSFSERPQPSLSVLRVVDARGRLQQTVRVSAAAGDPLSLAAPVPRLPRGLYTVDWRAVSAVDGHASFGKYVFGVGVTPPKGAVSATTSSKPATSKLELLARWILLTGLVLLVGAAVAGAARFGGTRGTDLLLAAGGALLAVIGLLLLAEAQRRTAHSSLTSLLDTPVGGALVGRAVAIAVAGAALVAARRLPRVRVVALIVAAGAATVAIVVHVAAGHAAAGSWPTGLTVLAQTTHFLAAGVWVGGLAALLLGLAGSQPGARLAAVRRFSAVALAALAVLVTTGVVRAIDELSSFGDLTASGYGRAVLAKILLVGLIFAAAARNRRRNVARSGDDPGPLRRTSRVELGLAAVALATAALLGTLSPPVAGKTTAPPGLRASGADAAKTVRVELKAASAEPGPNAFTARVERYDSHEALRGARVALGFDPLDDPAVRPTRLALAPTAAGTYAGSGPNLRFDGRWRVTARVASGGRAVDVPLDLDLPGPDQRVSVLRAPGQAPEYTMQIGTDIGYLRITPKPERAGPSTLTIDAFDAIQSEASLKDAVVTTAAGDATPRPVATHRLATNSFRAAVTLAHGRNTIAVVAHELQGGQRFRGVFDLEVP